LKITTLSQNELKYYTMNEIIQHNTKDSAWSVINGVVYDFTRFLYNHPGGFGNIFRAIGKDGTSTFRIIFLIYNKL